MDGTGFNKLVLGQATPLWAQVLGEKGLALAGFSMGLLHPGIKED